MYPGMGDSFQLRRVESDDFAPPELEPLSTSHDHAGGGVECGHPLGHEKAAGEFVSNPPSPFEYAYRGVFREVLEFVADGEHRPTPVGPGRVWGSPGAYG
ncbi:hypothetical protein GCM10010275_19610 [Streptomyces litmocidini]|nr:hypothetical protein GCM10010275_19610 [Streptomyces litmocidini]